jgi:hypothetical protein
MQTNTVSQTLIPAHTAPCGTDACAPQTHKQQLTDEMMLDSALLLLFIGDVALLSLMI